MALLATHDRSNPVVPDPPARSTGKATSAVTGVVSLSTMTGTMWQGVPRPHTMGPAMQSDMDRAMMQVNPDNVLDVRKALLAEAEDLQRFLYIHQPGMKVGDCGSDPVSHPAADAFNDKIQAHLKEANAYVRSLIDAGSQLAQVARTYGHTEAQIAASFTSRNA